MKTAGVTGHTNPDGSTVYHQKVIGADGSKPGLGNIYIQRAGGADLGLKEGGAPMEKNLWESMDDPMPVTFTGGYPIVAATALAGILTFLFTAMRGDKGARIGNLNDEQPNRSMQYRAMEPLPPPNMEAPPRPPAPSGGPRPMRERGPALTRYGTRNRDPYPADRVRAPVLYQRNPGDDPAVKNWKRNANAIHAAEWKRKNMTA